VLAPVFEREGGRKGRLSLQTNPANYGNTDLMLEQGIRFADLAPNMQVKFPATRAGIAAIERATAAGVNVNATVCFTVPQALAVAEAVERGLDAWEAAGGDPAAMSPVCTIMIGRLDDWMRVLVERDDIAINPDALDWAGIAAFKRAYRIYRERGYRTRLLAAAYRHRLHWTELVGGDVVLTMTHAWQVRFNGSGIVPEDRIDEPVDPLLVADLLERIPDFRRAYEPDGMAIDEFDGYGATVRTLRGFIRSYHDLVGAIRDIVLPDPDKPS
jgi:transaldolase